MRRKCLWGGKSFGHVLYEYENSRDSVCEDQKLPKLRIKFHPPVARERIPLGTAADGLEIKG